VKRDDVQRAEDAGSRRLALKAAPELLPDRPPDPPWRKRKEGQDHSGRRDCRHGESGEPLSSAPSSPRVGNRKWYE